MFIYGPGRREAATMIGHRSGGNLAARSGQLRRIKARISSSTALILSKDSISRRMAASSSVESTRPRKISMGMVDRHHAARGGPSSLGGVVRRFLLKGGYPIHRGSPLS